MYWGSQTNLILISSVPKVFEFYFYHNTFSIHTHTHTHNIVLLSPALFFSLQISTYWLLLNNDFGNLGSEPSPLTAV